MGWFHSITDLELSADGTVIGDMDGDEPTILGASWTNGRTDWFASLSPAMASFTLLGDLSASVAPGDPLVLERASGELWTGKVDTVTPNLATGQPTTTTVSGGDFVAQLGEARLKSETIPSDVFEEQLADAIALSGITATIVRAPSNGDTSLGAWTTYTGSVLEFINTAERGANVIVVARPDGGIRVCRRDAFPDYGSRIFDEFLVAPGLPGLPSASSLWRMDESSGELTDLINVRNGTAAGTPTYGQTGPWGSDGPDAIAFQAAGAADKFTIGDFYDLTGGTWDIAGWFYWSGSGTCTIMSKFTSSPSNNGWAIDVSASGLRYRSFDSGTTTTSIDSGAGSITANTWSQFNVSASGGTVRLHLDGVTVDSDTLGTIPNTTADLRIGTLGNASNWWDGRLCMLSIWNSSALTATQVHELIYLDHVELPVPITWSAPKSVTSVYNRFLVGGNTYSDATSITAYGLRVLDADDSDSLADPAEVYSPALRAIVKDPRPIVTATYSVTDTSSPLITIAPLTLALYDGTLYQVLQVQHDLDPSEWRVTLTLDRTLADMTGGASLLPV